MKAANSVNWPVPVRSAALIDENIREFRPAIAAEDNSFLLPGEGGTDSRSHNGLSAALVNIIAKYVGVRRNLHLLRHRAAWRYLKQYPSRYEDVRRLLGHRDVKTTMAFQVELEAEAAALPLRRRHPARENRHARDRSGRMGLTAQTAQAQHTAE